MVKGDIVGSVWFGGSVGIVLSVTDCAGSGETEFKLRAHVKAVVGVTQERDEMRIRDTGHKFPVEEAISLILKKGTYTVPLSLLLTMERSW